MPENIIPFQRPPLWNGGFEAIQIPIDPDNERASWAVTFTSVQLALHFLKFNQGEAVEKVQLGEC